MKSLHRGNIAGNAKLRGKKTLMLSCKCCTVENFKEECREKELSKEIANQCNHPNAIKEEHLTGEGAMEYVEWYDNECPDCGEHWTSND